MATLLRIVAVVTSSLVLVGFLAFASDEAARGSASQIDLVDGSAADESKRERRSGPVREVIDAANDVLLAPFDEVADSRNAWVRRLIPTALGLLFYGLALTLAANYLPKPKRADRNWRTA